MRFIWPLDNHTISRGFYYRSSIYIGGQHMAVDIPANLGTPIKAVAAGKVLAAGFSDINGNYVDIGHDAGWRTKYRHLMEPAFVSAGAMVFQGQVIGRVGSTGWSTGPHLHFDLWNASKQSPEAVYKVGVWAHDPQLYLGQEEDDMTAEEAEAIYRQIDALRGALGLGAIMYPDESGALSEAPLLKRVKALEVHERNAEHHLSIQQIKDSHGPHGATGGLKRGDKVTLE